MNTQLILVTILKKNYEIIVNVKKAKTYIPPEVTKRGPNYITTCPSYFLFLI